MTFTDAQLRFLLSIKEGRELLEQWARARQFSVEEGEIKTKLWRLCMEEKE